MFGAVHESACDPKRTCAGHDGLLGWEEARFTQLSKRLSQNLD
jgi:hypothetical protein